LKKRKILTRREFLLSSGLVGAAALLQACGQSAEPTPIVNRSTSIPTITGTSAPTAESLATATLGAPTATGTPRLDTATPTIEVVQDLSASSPIEPTDTPTPFPTPTPTPTPYPPGPPTKLGLHLTRYEVQALDMIFFKVLLIKWVTGEIYRSLKTIVKSIPICSASLLQPQP
jgi:hypothetical protein